MALRRFVTRMSLNQADIQRRELKLHVAMGTGGVFAAPSTPREPNVGLVIFYRIFDGQFGVCFA